MSQSLSGLGHELASPQHQLRVLNSPTAAHKRFDDSLDESSLFPLTATGIEIFQINVGKLCNQVCHHCHVDAGPDRTENMTRETVELCVEALARTQASRVDLTGGAPGAESELPLLGRRVQKIAAARDGPLQPNGADDSRPG